MHLNTEAKRVGKTKGYRVCRGMRMPLVLPAFERPCRRGMRLTLVLPRNPLIGCALVQCSLVNETGGPLHSDTNGCLLARERERCLMILVCACLRRWQIRSRKSNSWQPCPVSRRPPCAARRNCCDHQPAARSSLASLLAVRACGPRPKPSQQPARQWTRNSARSLDAVCACLRS